LMLVWVEVELQVPVGEPVTVVRVVVEENDMEGVPVRRRVGVPV